MTNAVTLDPVTIEISWNSLRSVADECYLTIMRSAYSTNIKERHDHSTAIADAQGRLIVQADNALPIHLASMAGLIGHVLEQYSDSLAPGDIFVANDPHVAGGSHLPDINMAMPIFEGDRLLGFVANIVHHADVGGASVGSMSGGLNEVYKEGLRIPLLRLFRKGELVEDILRFMLLNMRLPDERLGDLNAQIAAVKLGVKRVGELISRYGAEHMIALCDEIVSRTNLRMRRAIAGIPDGEYSFSDVMDDDGLGTLDVKINLTIQKSGEKIVFDFAGTSPQCPGNFNMTLNTTRSAVCYALKALLDPEVPNNQGIFDAIEIKADPATFVNCVAPAGVAMRANSCQRVVDVVLGAFADALPDRVIGAANGANTSAVFAGKDPRTGNSYVYLETLGGGMGARATKDGKDGVQVHITNTGNLPVEAIELEYPLRVEEYSLVENSGGAGKYRGGMGIRRVIRPIGHLCEFNGVGERFRHQPWGVFGGEAGAAGQFYLKNDDGSQKGMPSKISGVFVTESSSVTIETPGAGGYGKPEERSADDLRADQVSGKFSPDFISKYYGG